MTQGYKEQLSNHVENIFKQYSTSGLHICDIATGGGKSYTIGKLTCEYYPRYFDRIIILCVQNKLVVGMDKEIERFISQPSSLIHSNDKLVIENNIEVTLKAIKEDSFRQLFNEMDHEVDCLKSSGKDLTYAFNKIKKTHEGLASMAKTYEENKNEYLLAQITDAEKYLRSYIRNFFDTYKKYKEHSEGQRKVALSHIHKQFPTLRKVYPQVDFKDKRVLLMTVQKAMYGIDPILSEKIYITDFADKKKRTLILFDESDQAAVAMRGNIIDQAIEAAGGSKRFLKGYNGYLQYRDLIESYNHITYKEYGTLLEDALKNAKTSIDRNWTKIFKDVPPFKNIFLPDSENLEEYRNGVFFSGPAMRLNISKKDEKENSFICHKKGDRHLTLEHSDNQKELEKRYHIAVPLASFLSMIVRNTSAIKTQLRNVVNKSLQANRDRFDEEAKSIGSNVNVSNSYMGYPTLEREIHTLFSRFETNSEYQYEQQLNEFITNRKNIILADGTEKMPDYSVYSQGVQLFQEEVDERDNQHRVRLSCREITTTPEKILIDIVNSGDNAVVLCSATASSRSVVSNFDMEYLHQVLGSKVIPLSRDDRDKFDDLMNKTYPEDHCVEIVPIEHYEFEDKRFNHLSLPDEYRKLFSKDAQEDGSAEKWFRLTKRELEKNQNSDESSNPFYELYRHFQFIKAYHWFFTHDDIHSMIYFQNMTGKRNKIQINILSSLIDGSYKDMSQFEDELPKNWDNKHIRISKDLEDVENSILKELSENKDSKIMLVAAYNSFKAGTNLQYAIPDGLDVLSGDNWETDPKAIKKDWDAVFLQYPTNYLMTSDDGNETTFEKSIYSVMLNLMMLYERGCLSKYDVRHWLNVALSGKFWISDKTDPGVKRDKSAWVQTIVEQAVGRLCRTRNKPHKTYILYDVSMVPLFDKSNLDKSLTKEFRLLSEYILSYPKTNQPEKSSADVIRCNTANSVQRLLKIMRGHALKYLIPKVNDEFEDDDEITEDQDAIPYIVRISQVMNQSFKQTIIKKPVIYNIEELTDEDKFTTFIGKCYADWPRNERNEYGFRYDSEKKKFCTSKDIKFHAVSPETVRLNLLMSNPVIRQHFESHGFATEWKPGGLILHPNILMYDYCGEIGEEAFKAIVIHYCGVDESEIRHLEGKDYELADFVLIDSYGKYRIAFDVKNMRDNGRRDRIGDRPTTQKRRDKIAKLGCSLITVNILRLKNPTIDAHEIGGILNEDGTIIHESIEHLKNLIHPNR